LLPGASHAHTQRGRANDCAHRHQHDRLLAAERPVIIAGRELAQRNAFADAGELALLLGAAVFQEPIAYNARFPVEHPACMGDLTRNQSKARESLSPYDLLFCLGADLLRMSPLGTVEPLPDGLPVLHLTERDWELGKNYPTELALRADVKETLRALLPVLRERRTHAQAVAAEHRIAALADRNWTARNRRAREAVSALATRQPIDPRFAMMSVVDALPDHAIVVEEALTATAALNEFLPARDPNSFYGLASGGLGFAAPGAIGISLAQATRPVVATIGDGSSMYAIQSLWTAAHLRLPITYVIINNRSYRIIKERLLAGRKSDQFVAMDMSDPPIDFVAVASGMGMAAQRITDPSALRQALEVAIRSGRPNLVEVVVDDGFGNHAAGSP
jgi:benzoylformate decarboxylase